MEEEDYTKYEKEIIDIDEVAGGDIKINADYYIHSALIKAQQALLNPDINQGFAQYRQFIEHIEILCKAAKILPEDYDKQINDFKTSKEYAEETKELTKFIKLANKKLEFIMCEVFNSKTITDSIKA